MAGCQAPPVRHLRRMRPRRPSAKASRRLGLPGGGSKLGDVKSEIRNPKFCDGGRHSEFRIPNSDFIIVLPFAPCDGSS